MSTDAAAADDLADEIHDDGAAVVGADTATGPAAATERPRLAIEEFVAQWHRIALRANATLRDPEAATFMAAIERIDDEVAALLREEPEASLLLLIHTIGADLQRYSAMHGLTVAMACDLASRGLPGFDAEQRISLRRAALTMNIGMTRLQDQLAQQSAEVTPEQRTAILGHAAQSVALLSEMGVANELWLEAVANHHDAPPGALGEQPPAMRLARMIQRADLFVARMSPRKSRAALSAALAAKGAYYDENDRPDEAGSLVIKALGIYPAGSYVQLASGELAIVLRRGVSSSKPVVTAIADGHGMPYVQSIVRNTAEVPHAVVRGVPPKDVRVRVAVERLLKLAR